MSESAFVQGSSSPWLASRLAVGGPKMSRSMMLQLVPVRLRLNKLESLRVKSTF